MKHLYLFFNQTIRFLSVVRVATARYYFLSSDWTCRRDVRTPDVTESKTKDRPAGRFKSRNILLSRF